MLYISRQKSNTEYLKNLNLQNNETILNWLLSQDCYFGIGKKTEWSYSEGTGVNENNPPIPFIHNNKLYSEFFFHKVKYFQPIIKETFINDGNIILKKISKKNYKNLEENYLVLNKNNLNNNFEIDLEFIYIEIELDYNFFLQDILNNFRELSIELITKKDSNPLYFLNKTQYKDLEFNILLLNYFTKIQVEKRKKINQKFIIKIK